MDKQDMLNSNLLARMMIEMPSELRDCLDRCDWSAALVKMRKGKKASQIKIELYNIAEERWTPLRTSNHGVKLENIRH